MPRLGGSPRRTAIVRLVALAAVVAALAAVAAVELPHSPSALRHTVAATGTGGLVAATFGWALLTPALVSGTVLALAAGLLFGPAVGTAIGVIGATCGGVASFLLARHAGRDAVEALAGPRLRRILEQLDGRGFVPVLIARVTPGMPATWLNYAAGLTGVRLAQFAAAIALGGAPRTFAYATLGGSGGNLESPGAVAALAAIVGTSVAAAAGGWWVRRRRRR